MFPLILGVSFGLALIILVGGALLTGWLIMVVWGIVASIFDSSKTIAFWPAVGLGALLTILRSILFRVRSSGGE